jgi:D-alanine--D-alanine ligase
MNRPHIVVFFGGNPGTYDLSRETGHWVCQYIPRTQYQVTPVHVTAEGLWQVPLGSLPQAGNTDVALERLFQAIPALSPLKAMERLIQRPLGALLTVLRGANGDDGALHSLGRALNIPVVGSSLQACLQTAHKGYAAQALDDVATTPYSRIFKINLPIEEIMSDIERDFVPPFFIKPAAQESSIGIEEVQNVSELPAALQRAAAHGDMLVQEKAVGTELSISLMEDSRGRIHLLPTTIIAPQKSSYYDTLSKRIPGRATLHHPTAGDNPVITEAQAIARDVYDSLGCSGIVSVDMVSGDGIIDVLEVNTIPTLSAATPLLHQLRHANIHPTAALEGIIKRTLNRGSN